jgi:uncharacterized protein YhjY with autotransporter beta-barrel domain
MSGEAHRDRRVTWKRPKSKGRALDVAYRGRLWSTHLHSAASLGVFMALVGLSSPQPVRGQTFDEASSQTLQEIIDNNWIKPGSALERLVSEGNTPAGMVSAAPAAVSPQATAGPTIERRLQAVRESEERRREAGVTRAIPASYPRDVILADNRQLQLPPTGGASPEIVAGPAQGLSLFVSAGVFALNHHNNRFEDGYEAQLPTVTAGADYWFTPRLLAGVAFNYTNFDGTYDDGGGFDKDIFGPVLYATFLPLERAFVNVVLGYARNENSNDRKVVIPRINDDDPGLPVPPFIGHTAADYAEDQYSAGLQAGYDHPIGSFTIGPRVGFALNYSEVDSFKEKGDTGGELRYSGLNQTSVQSSVGVAATVAVPIPNGVLLPQASFAWVHEYANDARNVDARFVDASPSPKFTFKRERPARDWANIAVGVSASLTNGLQPFVQFVTVQGNDNYVSYGGTAGLRFSF